MPTIDCPDESISNDDSKIRGKTVNKKWSEWIHPHLKMGTGTTMEIVPWPHPLIAFLELTIHAYASRQDLVDEILPKAQWPAEVELQILAS